MQRLIFAAVVAVLPLSAQAVTYNEIGDAGELLATAQPAGNGITSIVGTLADLDGADDIDLYSINISNTSAFSVTVSSNLSVDNDAHLWLFDSTGALVIDDDDGGPGFVPQFNVGALTGFASGLYYLAYNLYATTPSFTDGALSGWDRSPNPFQTGPYTLTITGTGAVPEPESWAMLIAGFALSGAAMRRRRVVHTV